MIQYIEYNKQLFNANTSNNYSKNKQKNKQQLYSQGDITIAVKKLSTLGGGFRIIQMGKTTTSIVDMLIIVLNCMTLLLLLQDDTSNDNFKPNVNVYVQ